MYIFLAALGLALLLALVALACACRMLRNDMRRGKDCMDLSVPEAAANTRWAPYAAEVSESIKRLRALPWEEVRISAAEGFSLRARLLRGTSGDTAILVHGYRSCGELDFALTAEHYLELGFGLLMVDQRGHGGSGGKMVTMGLRESGDVRRWAEFAERELGGRIWLHGVSLGGASVLYAAGRGLPGSVRGIIADSSFCSPEEAIRWQLKKHSRSKADNKNAKGRPEKTALYFIGSLPAQALAALSISSTIESVGVAPASSPQRPRTASISISNCKDISAMPL